LKTVQELQSSKIRPPQTVTDILHGGWAIRILKSAVEIGLFEQLLDGPANAKAVAQKLGMPLHGVTLMLNALVGLKLLVRGDLDVGDVPFKFSDRGDDTGEATYGLSEEARVYLLKDSPLFAGMYLRQHDELEKMWRSLTDTISSGKPVMEVNTDATAEEIFPRLAEAIIPLNYAISCDVVRYLKELNKAFDKPLKILDLACGSAIWSIPFAQDNKWSKIDALDFPAVLEVAKRISAKFGVSDNFHYLTGNWRQVKIAEAHYDVAILGHILHSEGKELSKNLLTYCHGGLRSGGVLVIGEFMTNKEHTGPLFPLMFGINMHLATTDGCVFSEDELKQMCLDAGFSDVIRHTAAQYESTVLLAVK